MITTTMEIKLVGESLHLLCDAVNRGFVLNREHRSKDIWPIVELQEFDVANDQHINTSDYQSLESAIGEAFDRCEAIINKATARQYQLELVWNRENDFVTFGPRSENLQEVIELAIVLENSGDGARIKETRIVDQHGSVVWQYGKLVEPVK